MRSVNKIYNAFTKITKVVSWGSCFVLIFMILMITANVILRKFFHTAIRGSIELVELSMVALGSCAIAYTQATHGHITITILLKAFPGKWKIVSYLVMNVLCLGLTSCVFWAAVQQTLYGFEIGKTSTALEWPLAPFYILVGVGFLLMAIMLLLEIVKCVIALGSDEMASLITSDWV